MSVSNVQVKQTYVGNGSTTTFAIPFDYKVNSEIRVILRDESVTPATETVQALTTNYTLLGSPATDVVMLVPPPSTSKLIIKRQSAKTQATNYIETGEFPAESHEDALDKLTRLVQEQGERLDRAPVLPETDQTGVIELPQPEADLFFKWDDTGTAIEYGELVVTDALKATQAEAEAGTDNDTFMSPLRVAQARTINLASQAEAEAGTDNTKIMTPLRSKQSVIVFAPTQQSKMSNLGLSASVASNILTVELKQQDGSTDPGSASGDMVSISFRDSTATDGSYTVVNAVAATSIAVPDTATLGTSDAVSETLYVYAIDDSGTLKLAISKKFFDEHSLVTTNTLNVGSDSNSLIYSTTGVSDVPCRLIGRLKVTEATAGTWATAPSELSVASNLIDPFVPEFVESTRSSDYTQSSPTVSTWYIPDNTYNITITPGTWLIGLKYHTHILGNAETVGNLATFLVALGTSTTPGSSLIETNTTYHHATTTSGGDFPIQSQQFETTEYTNTSEETIYISLRWEQFQGSPTIASGSVRLRTANFDDIRLYARRISKE